MRKAAWEHVRGDTWCIRTDVTIPVYFLNDSQVVLLDSGWARDRAALDRALAEKGVRVRAVLGSHSHWDHNGSHAYYQRTHGAEIILQEVEAAAVSDYALMVSIYAPATAADLERELPYMRLRADRTFAAGDESVDIDGRTFGLIPLPGHTPGHTGLVTPDNVLYAADGVMGPKALADARMPSTMDWGQDFASKERLRRERHRAYILAHEGVYEDIVPLIDRDIADRRRRAEQAMEWLGQREQWTAEQAERLMWQRLGLCPRHFLTQTIFRRNLRCLLGYLTEQGRLDRRLTEGVETYTVTGK